MFNHYDVPQFDGIAFEIGPFPIAWYAVFILTGVLVATILGILEGKKIGIPQNFIEDLVMFGLIIAVIGARIWYVIFEWDKFKGDLISIVRIDQGGLAIHGAVAAAVIWGYFFSKARGVNFLKAIDLGAVGFVIAQAIGRWGNFMNQEAHGGLVPGATLDAQRAYLQNLKIPDFIVNQMFIKNTNESAPVVGYYHPTFLYESLWNILGFILMLILRRTKLLYIGDLGLLYLIWYGVGRYFIEGMRTDSLYVWGTGLRTAQVTSILMVIAGVVLLSVRHIKKLYPKYYFECIEENKKEPLNEV